VKIDVANIIDKPMMGPYFLYIPIEKYFLVSI